MTARLSNPPRHKKIKTRVFYLSVSCPRCFKTKYYHVKELLEFWMYAAKDK